MNRRRLLVGLGAVASSGVLATGTGAFSQATVSRQATIQVANDATGGVGLIPGETVSAVFLNSAGELVIDTSEGDADGMNPNSVYWLGASAGDNDITLDDVREDDVTLSDIDHPLFSVRNQSTADRLIRLSLQLGPVPDEVTVYLIDWSADLGQDPSVMEFTNQIDEMWEFTAEPGQQFHFAAVFDIGVDPDRDPMQGMLSVTANKVVE